MVICFAGGGLAQIPSSCCGLKLKAGARNKILNRCFFLFLHSRYPTVRLAVRVDPPSYSQVSWFSVFKRVKMVKNWVQNGPKKLIHLLTNTYLHTYIQKWSRLGVTFKTWISLSGLCLAGSWNVDNFQARHSHTNAQNWWVWVKMDEQGKRIH